MAVYHFSELGENFHFPPGRFQRVIMLNFMEKTRDASMIIGTLTTNGKLLIASVKVMS